MILKSTLQIRFGTSQIFFFQMMLCFQAAFLCLPVDLTFAALTSDPSTSVIFMLLTNTSYWTYCTGKNTLPRGGQIYSGCVLITEVGKWSDKHLNTQKRITFSTLRRLENHLDNPAVGLTLRRPGPQFLSENLITRSLDQSFEGGFVGDEVEEGNGTFKDQSGRKGLTC